MKKAGRCVLAVRDGKVFKIGNNADILALVGTQTQQIDLKGRMIMPTFSFWIVTS